MSATIRFVRPRRLVFVATLLTMASVSSPLLAQEADLPKGETLLDKYIEVTGGAETYKKLKSRVSTGTIEFVGAGIKGNLSLYQKAPNMMLTNLEIEQVGTISQGTDGKVAWEQNAITGDRVLEGEEKANFVREADFYGEINWRDNYSSAETKGVEEVEGKTCYKVELTPKEGTPITQYFDKDSGLLVKQTLIAKTPMGDIPVEATLGDYREVDGIKIPFQSTQTVLTQVLKTTFDQIEHNVEIPAEKFEVPESIKKLIVD